MMAKFALVLLLSWCWAGASGELSQDGLVRQADTQTQLRELQAVVKKLGEVAVRHTMTLSATQSEVTSLETRVTAGERQAEDQSRRVGEQTLLLSAVTSDMRAVEARVETSEKRSQQHQTTITQLGMKLEVAYMQLQASKKQVDRLQEENAVQVTQLRNLEAKLKASETQLEHVKNVNEAQTGELEKLSVRSSQTEEQVKQHNTMVVDLTGKHQHHCPNNTTTLLPPAPHDSSISTTVPTTAQPYCPLCHHSSISTTVPTTAQPYCPLCPAIAAQDVLLSRLGQHMSAIQSQVQEQATAVLELKDGVDELREQNKNLSVFQDLELVTLNKRSNVTEAQLYEHDIVIEELKTELKRLKSENAAQNSELDVLENRSNSTNVQINQILSEMVDLNVVIEKLEKETAGVFTVPVSGVYFFRFTVATETPSYSSGAILYRNQEQVLNIFTHDKNGQLRHYSSGTVLQVNKGDKIYLRLDTNYQLYDDAHNHNTFGGFLLFPI
ncbi:hypothetical protein ACEWY4_009211 [Coilia grayii]|uniref:C1q domain-containing protein n=1 Tax=Coilia grayii TaxID=363190 RepID=A0ABD1K5S2_9TELE